MTPSQRQVLEAMQEGKTLRVDLGTFWLDGGRLNKRTARPLINQKLIEREYGGLCHLTPTALALLSEAEA